MFFVRRNGEMKKKNQGKKKVNSVNGGSGRKDKAKKKEKRETKKWGAKISAPTFKTQPKLSQLSQIELTQSN